MGLLLINIGKFSSSKIVKYELPQQAWEQLFGFYLELYPQEVEWATFAAEGFCKKYEIREDGVLVLYFTEQQLENWKAQAKADIGNPRTGVVRVSSDYTKVDCYSEKQLDLLEARNATEACYILRLLDGENPEDINVEYNFYESFGGKAKFSILWPNEELP